MAGSGTCSVTGCHFLSIQIKGIADGILGLFAVVPLFDGPQITHHPGIYLGFLVAIRTGFLLAVKIAV